MMYIVHNDVYIGFYNLKCFVYLEIHAQSFNVYIEWYLRFRYYKQCLLENWWCVHISIDKSCNLCSNPGHGN